MSEGWGGDAIPPQASGRLNLVEALSVAQHMPAEAMEEAVRRPEAVAGAVLSAAERAAAGEDLTARERNLLFWGAHVLGQARDTRLFRPLVSILRQPGEAMLDLFGDVIITTLPNVAISVFDGDTAALEELLGDRQADESIRWSLFSAYAFLAVAARIERPRAHGFLVRFDDERLARAGDLAWTGWQDAIALLGFVDLTARREAALADARLMSDDDLDERYAALLARAVAAPDDLVRFEEQGIGFLDDAVGDSGKKFKKCCLDLHAA